MRERRKLIQQVELAKAQHALRARADQDLLDATHQETLRREEMRKAQAQVDEAAGEWAAHLGRGSIDPILLTQLAGDITRKDTVLRNARETVTRAADVTLQRRHALSICDVQTKQSDKVLHRLRKAAAYDAEEAAAASFEELIAWRMLAT